MTNVLHTILNFYFIDSTEFLKVKFKGIVMVGKKYFMVYVGIKLWFCNKLLSLNKSQESNRKG